MTEEFICTTRLEYADRFEGQIIYKGDQESCENIANSIPAIAVSGGETPIEAAVLVRLAEILDDLPVGQKWVMMKKEKLN